MFGVILDVGLKVTENSLYQSEYELMDYHEFSNYFKTKILMNKNIELFFADFSIGSSSFLREMLVTGYLNIQATPVEIVPLVEESNINRDRFFIDISRACGWGKSLRWYLQKKTISYEEITRNNAMRSPFERLKYYSPSNTDILQEYFIPFESFVSFTDSLRMIVRKHNANLINCTIRYINKANYVKLNYAKKESLAFVLYFNIPIKNKFYKNYSLNSTTKPN